MRNNTGHCRRKNMNCTGKPCHMLQDTLTGEGSQLPTQETTRTCIDAHTQTDTHKKTKIDIIEHIVLYC